MIDDISLNCVVISIYVPYSTHMSILRGLTEFMRGINLVENLRWSAATSEFLRASEIMTHAHQLRDANLAKLYAGTSLLYSGDAKQAFDVFSCACKNVDGSDPLTSTGLRFQLAANLQYQIGVGTMPPQSTYPQSSTDPWIRLTIGKEPMEGSFPWKINRFVKGIDRNKLVPSCGIEMEAIAYANTSVASQALLALPKANSEGICVQKETELVNIALKSSEKLRARGREYQVIGTWYVGNCLLMRGTLFQFNGNALMAEAMYRAAHDLRSPSTTPRINLLHALANNKLGDLLEKWEKREAEGQALKAGNPLPPTEVIQKYMITFVPEPTFEQLDILNV
jgi:hypothetical protein